MTTQPMTHEQFEALLPAWMEGELRGSEREAFTAHAASCADCGSLVRDLEQIVARAGTLGPIEPPRELWDGIEARIGATVLPLASRRRTIPLMRGLAAAAVLVAATGGITWKLAQRAMLSGAAPVVATNTPPDSMLASTGSGNQNPPTSGPVLGGPIQKGGGNDNTSVASTSGSSAAPHATQRAATPRQLAPSTVTQVRNEPRLRDEDKVYDREITRLRTVLRQRRSQLDPRTVLAIEQSLAVIDTAIAQARSALAADPASRFLEDRLTSVLDKKVELLRTAALLPARS